MPSAGQYALTLIDSSITTRAVYRNFAEGGANLGYGQKRGGAPGGSSIVSCEVLHSRGGENDTFAPTPP